MRPHKVEDFVNFSNLTLQFLLQTGQIIDGALPEQPLPVYARLPEYVLGAITACLNVTPVHQIPEPTELLRRFALIFSNKLYVRSSIIKSRIVSFFSSVAKDQRTRYLVVGLPRIIELMFPRLLEFYSSIQVTGTNDMNFDRFNYRFIASDLLIAWLSIPDLQVFFRSQAADPIYTKFVFYLVDDSLTLADKSLNELKTIANANREGQEGDTNENAQVVEELQNARTSLSHWVPAVDKAFQVMVVIATFAAQVFHEPVVLDGLTKLLLCYMDAFVNHSEYFSVENLRDVTFDPRALLTSLLRIANAVVDELVIIDRLVANEMFPAEPMLDALKAIAAREGIDSDVLRRFEGFSQVVKERKLVLEADKVDISDAPEEFLDRVTYELMKEPMRLPSGCIMDHEALQKMLLSRPVDPWTALPLTIEECVPDTELKQQIEEYLAQKRAQRNR
jgi:ubiquitin conjugation factor E4 B